MDYYGLTFAADIATRYLAKEADAEEPADSDVMMFATTFALTYAVGRGEMVRGAIGGPSDALYQEVSSEVTAHEVMLHVGSTLMH